jgi:hypothetical protein
MKAIEYDVLKDNDKLLNHLNLWLVHIDSIIYVNTPLKYIDLRHNQ